MVFAFAKSRRGEELCRWHIGVFCQLRALPLETLRDATNCSILLPGELLANDSRGFDTEVVNRLLGLHSQGQPDVDIVRKSS